MPFKKGQSGNPGGRKRSLCEAVRAVTGEDGQKLISNLALIAWGSIKDIKAKLGAVPTINDRRMATCELADRGFGKSVLSVEHSGSNGGPVIVKVIYDDAGKGGA